VGNAAPACIAFEEFADGTMNIRTWNALLSGLAQGAILDWSATIQIDLFSSDAPDILERGVCNFVNGKTCYDAIPQILFTMECNGDQALGIPRATRPNSQNFCIAASILSATVTKPLVLSVPQGQICKTFALLHPSLKLDPQTVTWLWIFFVTLRAQASRPMDVSSVALFRCFGDDIKRALSSWKSEIWNACLAHEYRRHLPPPSDWCTKGKNLASWLHIMAF
jgi:hypothetical protein